MTKVIKCTVAFSGKADGDIYPSDHEVGDLLEGKLAAVALTEGWAEEVEDTGGPADPAVTQTSAPPGSTVAATEATKPTAKKPTSAPKANK